MLSQSSSEWSCVYWKWSRLPTGEVIWAISSSYVFSLWPCWSTLSSDVMWSVWQAAPNSQKYFSPNSSLPTSSSLSPRYRLANFLLQLFPDFYVGLTMFYALYLFYKSDICWKLDFFFAQVFTVCVHLFDQMSCVNKVIIFLSHQIGITMSSSSLLVMVRAFYWHVIAKNRVLTTLMKSRILRRAIIMQIAVDLVRWVGFCIVVFCSKE